MTNFGSFQVAGVGPIRFVPVNGSRVVSILLACAMLALAGCAVDIESMMSSTPTSGATGLAEIGPTPSSHWHAAYVVRICDDVLAPFDDLNESLGIHTHGDGLIHIHPFGPDAAYERATLGAFGDVVGLGFGEGSLSLPSGGTWRNGDLCDGVPGELTVTRWQRPDAPEPVETRTSGLADLRFLGDGEMFSINFAPPDTPPTVPPSAANLPAVSPRLTLPAPEPYVTLPDVLDRSTFRLWPVEGTFVPPCVDGQVPELTSLEDPRCFVEGTPSFDVSRVKRAAAVAVSGVPALSLEVDREVVDAFNAQLGEDGLLIALEIEGSVIIAARTERGFQEARITFIGGFSADAAREMADLLNG